MADDRENKTTKEQSEEGSGQDKAAQGHHVERRKRKEGHSEAPEAVRVEEGPDGEERPDEQEREPIDRGEKAKCPIVGVGASAGGLVALQGLFSGLKANMHAAFVVIQHRSGEHSSVMKSLLEKNTPFEVTDIEDGTEVDPGTIYLAPAGQDVYMADGALQLQEAHRHSSVHLPIDTFLRSLAQDEAEKAICIILSGTGSDGTSGVKEIKGAGGMTMVQDPGQAKYDGMPQSAIDTGMVDFILPVEQMGERLSGYLDHPYVQRRATPDMEHALEEQLRKIFLLIRNETGNDFSHYKRSTIRRRIARRLAVHQIETLRDYIKLLHDDKDEVHNLAREMLITVTNFFRDREAFDALQKTVIEPLVEEKNPDEPIRIWVSGCATGEEAYSIAILVQEAMERAGKHHHVQVFATDLDDDAIGTARRGQYPKSIAADIAPNRLRRFFSEENRHYKVKGSIRDMLVFARHNITKDAPFSCVDLVSCRNLLIYLDGTLQQKLIPLFHYTLAPGGWLFLGESESIGSFSDLFAPADGKYKIFRRKPGDGSYEQPDEVGYSPSHERQREERQIPRGREKLGKLAERVILRDYSLPCVLVDQKFNIVYFSGDVTPYLTYPTGRPTWNLMHLARPELHYKLNALLKRAFHERHTVVEEDVQIRINDRLMAAEITVRPVHEPGIGDNLMLVVFKADPQEPKRERGEAATADVPEDEKDARIRELQQEVQATKEYLQTTIEELETSNEELKSSNEELQSTNEELQSTNEELDTSREELQSTNEELRTVNSEHQEKIEELCQAYNDLNNLLGATEVATIFLDRELCVRRFTPSARRLFRLMDRDIDRPIGDIASSIQQEALESEVQTVLNDLKSIEKEVHAQGQKDGCYRMRISPYRTDENVIDGVVITFEDIDEYKKVIGRLEGTKAFIEAIVETVREPLLVLDGELRVQEANAAFYRDFQVKPEQTVGVLVYDLGNGQWDIPALRELLEKIVPENKKFEDFRMEHEFPKLGRRTMLLNARQTVHEGEATGRILLAIEDVTDRQ